MREMVDGLFAEQHLKLLHDSRDSSVSMHENYFAFLASWYLQGQSKKLMHLKRLQHEFHSRLNSGM